jgi:hypothetical protein
VLAPQSFSIDALLFDPAGRYGSLTWPAIARSYAEVQQYLMLGESRSSFSIH